MLKGLLFLWGCMIFLGFKPKDKQAKTIFKVGQAAPNFSFTDTLGRQIDLSSFRGKVVLLEFWASWCRPCRENNKDLIDIYRIFHPKGFEVIAVSLDRSKEAWYKAIAQDELPWYLHTCDYKEFNSPLATLYEVEGIPAGFLIDSTGKFIAIHPDAYDVEKKLEKILKNSISFYPHHALNDLYFTTELYYEILNSENLVVKAGKGKQVDISFLKKGTYKVRYLGKEEKFHKH